MKFPSLDSITNTLKTVHQITLGTNKDGTPRSLFDAKLKMDKNREKVQKKQHKRLRKMMER